MLDSAVAKIRVPIALKMANWRDRHLDDAGHQAAEGPQDREQPHDQDGPGPLAGEEPLGPVEVAAG